MNENLTNSLSLAPDPERLRALLAPRSIAIIGATERLQYGGRLLQNLLRNGYPGRVYPVNPRRETVFDRKCYPSAGDLPEAVDLVVVVIPAPSVPAALREAAAAGARAAAVISAGFAETQDAAGADLQAELREIVRTTGMRVCGPNCLGVANLHERVWATANVLVPIDERLRPGPVALVVQSGATAFGPLLAIARERGIGIHSIVSSGNEADLTFADYASYLLRQPEVGAVAGIIEGIADGRGFLRAAAVAREVDKPIIALKLGRSAVGQAAARLHTAALGGDHTISLAGLRQAGVIVVEDYDLLLEVANAFATGRRLAGRRVAVLSHSGGIGGLLGDLCGDLGLEVPPLSSSTRERLAEILAGRGAAANPADVTMHYQTEAFGEIVRLLIADPGLDALAVASTGQNAATHVAAAAAETTKPVLFTWVGPADDPGRAILQSAGVPSFLLPGRCAEALRALAGFADWQARTPAAVEASASPVAESEAIGALGTDSARSLLAEAGIRLPRERLCRTADAAVGAAEEIGYPVALKGVSPEITHKTDVGAVVLGVADAAGVRAAFARVTESLRAAGATCEGALVQEMVDVSRGVELAVGVVSDPSWGPALMLAIGGTAVEALGLATWRVCPLAEREVDEMVSEVRGLGKLLDGYRGRPPLDRAALARAVAALSRLALRHPAAGFEVNPLVVLPEGEGVSALDVRVAR